MYPKHYFELFRPEIEDDLVFVGMSFAPEDHFRWTEIIAPAVVDAGMRPYRVDMTKVSDSILADIMRGIVCARFLMFDISTQVGGQRNGNVMYELGLAHAVRYPEEILMTRSDRDRLLFDIAGIRVHYYSATDVSEARSQLGALVQELVSSMDGFKMNLIGKAVSTLDEVCLGFLASHAGMPQFSLQDSSRAFAVLLPRKIQCGLFFEFQRAPFGFK